jgi:hypothetical protein
MVKKLKFGALAIALAFAMTVAGCSSDIPYVDIDRGLVGTWIGGVVIPAVEQRVNPDTGVLTQMENPARFWQQQRIVITDQEIRFYTTTTNHAVMDTPPLTTAPAQGALTWQIRNVVTNPRASRGEMSFVVSRLGAHSDDGWLAPVFGTHNATLLFQYQVAGNVLSFPGPNVPAFGFPDPGTGRSFEWRRQ